MGHKTQTNLHVASFAIKPFLCGPDEPEFEPPTLRSVNHLHRGRCLPVELVDVLNVAEQRADLLRFQRQSTTVDDAAEVILQTQRDTMNVAEAEIWF